MPKTLRVKLDLRDSADFRLVVPTRRKYVVAGTDAVYTVQSDALTGYVDDVDLSTSGLPTGASATIGTDPIGNDGMTDITVETTGTSAGTYEFLIGGDVWTPPEDVYPAASCELVDVQAAINAAGSGDTVTVPAGTATWTGTLTITKGVVVKGAGIGNTIITRNFAGDKTTFLIRYVPDATARANDEAFRWSGCTFIFTDQLGSCFDFYNRPYQTAMTRNRIDHCAFVGINQNARSVEVNGMFWGVMDNCTQDSGTVEFYGSNEVSWTYFTATPGGADNFFFEDNVIYYTGTNYGFGSGVGGRYCVRHNTIDVTGVEGTVQLFDVHGNGPAGGNLSSMICEFYENVITAGAKGTQFGDLRGGQGFIYNNHIDTTYTAFGPSVREEYVDSTLPPATNVIDGTPQHVHDSYIFNNIMHKGGVETRFDWVPNGTVTYPNPDPTGLLRVQDLGRTIPEENVDFWAEVSPFTGASGIGVGLLSARPSSGLTTGVGYWATDTNTLYRATGATTWETYYTPYTYPHPLRSDPILGD